ncbi:hypothetical protein UYO_0298 [Lachnospiraceae bacterium JC7]|nr:hypothetical protein UYO_0298 [Lachnospiraceae bacterium JC7]
MNLTVFIRKYKLYSAALIFDLMAVAASILAARSSFFANVYSHTIYRFGSLVISSITGLLPFSLVELLLYALLIFIPADLVFQIVSVLRRDRVLVIRLTVFLGHLFLILSLLFTLYVFNCGINYRRASFSTEAGLSSVSPELNEETLTKLCEYLVENINESESALHSGNDSASLFTANVSDETPSETSSFDTAVSPVRLYNGAILGENRFSEKPSLTYLWNTGKAGQAAMEKIGTRFSRLSGHYPLPKPLINSWILSIQQVTGVYSPFTIEANYNRDIPYYDIPFTVCHELSHLRGYMQEEEANFIAILATIGSDDAYFNYSGYVSAWVYAGNALAKADPEKFIELYSRLNSYTRQDMQYNNEFWDRYETEIAETQEKLNDAYLKYNGQSTGVLSYGHVVDLMVVYFNENGTLGY